MVRVRLYKELYNTFFRTLIDTLKHLASLHLFFFLFGQKVITCFTGEYLDFCPFGCCRRQILSSHKAPAYVIFCPFCCHKRPIYHSMRHPPVSYFAPSAVIKDQFIILWGTLLCHILLLDTQYRWISWCHQHLLSMNDELLTLYRLLLVLEPF